MTTDGPIFYTVAEVAEILRVDAATVYRSIRADAFPAVRIRSRYVIPAGAVIEMAEEAARSGGCVDLARRTQSVRQHRADHQR
ncbi:MAG: helix-turn-helix domain-containing protein [Pseudonocardia sp.]